MDIGKIIGIDEFKKDCESPLFVIMIFWLFVTVVIPFTMWIFK